MKDAFDISHDKFMNIPDLKPGASTTVHFTIPPGGPNSIYPTPGALMGVDWSRDYPQHGSAGAVIVSSQFNVLTVSPLNLITKLMSLNTRIHLRR